MAVIVAFGNPTFGTNDADDITGLPTADISIFGLAGNDTIRAGGGDDFVDAGDGNDFVFGEEGNDLLLGRSGNDILLGGQGSSTIFGEAGNDVLFGGSEDDFLLGGDGNDVLRGFGGNDELTGGPGSDHLTGDDGADSFEYNFRGQFPTGGFLGTAEQGIDVIQDFVPGTDVIRVNGIDSNLDTAPPFGVLDDADERVDATFGGLLYTIDFDEVPLVGGGTGSGTIAILGVSALEVGRDIVFT